MKKIILLSTLCVRCMVMAEAQPSLLDPTFGVHGIATTDMGTPFAYKDFGKQVFVQPDGSIYIVFEGAGSTLIAKRNPDGSPDATYGNNGFSVTAPVYAAHAAMQTDGKIVVGGFTTNPDYYNDQNDFALARFNTDGSLDNTFDEDGIQVTDVGSSDVIYSLAIQTDGKIVAAGRLAYAPYFDVTLIALARYNTDGSLDGSFGTNGIVTSRFNDIEYPNAVAVRNDGKIVVEGFIGNSDVLVLYNSDGTLDLGLNGTGYKNIDLGMQSFPHSIVIQSDNKIIAGSSVSNGNNIDFEVARFNTDGTPDNTFDGDGFQTTDFAGTGDTLTTVTLQSDGKIVVSGYTSEGGSTNFALARYTTNGSLDDTFDGDGKKTTDFGPANDYIDAIAIQSNGKIVAAGHTVNGTDTFLAAARYNSDGSPDNSFDGDGRLVDHVIEGDTHFTSTAIQSDGKIVAAGYTWNGSNYDFAIVRYNINGSLDNSFSGDGKQITGFATSNDYAGAIAIQSDGKIVVAGSAGATLALARYNIDGSPDNTFDGDGVLVTGIGGQDLGNAGLAIQSDGKIMVAGSALARFNTNGTPDLSFNGTGQLAITFGCNSIAIQSDSKIVVSGRYGGDGIIARYNADGSTDNTFGEYLNGSQGIFNGGDGFYWTCKSVAIQNDGKIVVGGSHGDSYRFNSASFSVIRLNADGTFDNSFGVGGFASASPGRSGLDFGNSLVIQPDNKIILAGSAYDQSNDNFALARFNADGTLDNTFSGDGIEVTKASSAYNAVAGIALANDNLYAVGYGQYPGNFGVVAKYLLNSGGPLPVTLIDFTGVLQNSSVLLQWQTASEHNLSRFSIERSLDGITFSGLGEVMAKGNSNTKINYSTFDRQPVKGGNFYRLKIFDLDGKFTYSKIVEVNLNSRLFTLQVYPNPASNILLVQASGENEKAVFRIFDAGGRKVQERKVILQGNTSFSIDINTLSKGTYYLQLNETSKTETKIFIKK